MGDVAHPSLRPPPHGYPPNEASPASWVLLDLHAYIADRENATTACGKTSNEKSIQVTFCTAPPPLVSYICVWCPDDEISAEPTVEASGSDLVLLCVSLRGSPHHAVDYFVYKATGGKGPSLRLLRDPNPCLCDRYNIALLAHRDVGKRGNLGSHAEVEDHYYIAALNRDKGSRLQDFRLWIFNSKDDMWTSRPFSLESIYCHITCKVINLGKGGLLGFVDPWRGIVVCDVLGRRPERFLPLPPELIRLDKFRDEPLLSRDIAFVRGRLSVVELCGIIIQGIDSNYWSWKVSSWSMKVTRRWEEDWQTDYMIQRHEISVDNNTANVNLLPNAHENEGTHQPTLAKLYIAHPTLSLSDNHIVYLMGKVTLCAKKALVLSVDMRVPSVLSVALFDAERMLGCTYVQSRISSYFKMTPGKRSAGHEIEKALCSKKHKSISGKIAPVKDGTNSVEKLPCPNKIVSSSLEEGSSDSKDEDPAAWLKIPLAASIQAKTQDSVRSNDDSSDEQDRDVPSKATVQTMEKEELSKSSNSTSYSNSKYEKPKAKVARNSDGSSEEDDDEESDELTKTPKQKPPTPTSSQSQATGLKTLFVRNLSYSIKVDQVKDFFEEAGEVVDIRLATSSDGNFKGFAHVEFATAESAKKALKLSGHNLMNRPVKLDMAHERVANTLHSRTDSNFFKEYKSSGGTIFVKGLDTSLGENQIRSSLVKHFGSCGEITRLSIPLDYDTGTHRGIAYIDFQDQSSLLEAIEMNGSVLGGFSLYIGEAKPRTNIRGTGFSGGRGGIYSGGKPLGRHGRRSARDDRGWQRRQYSQMTRKRQAKS